MLSNGYTAEINLLLRRMQRNGETDIMRNRLQANRNPETEAKPGKLYDKEVSEKERYRCTKSHQA